ncbi:HNH endonuclease [Nostoc ellipsosporum NOK]|nr:HNH endonuclease [Nostoc ellipsosporum NOK]
MAKKNYTREQVRQKCNGKCAYCGEVLPEKGWHIDHIQPIIRDWKYVRGKNGYDNKKVYTGCRNPELDCIDNCLPACAKCNINKHSMSVEEFRQAIYKYVQSLNLRMVQYQMAKKYGLVQETSRQIVFYFETLTTGRPDNI